MTAIAEYTVCTYAGNISVLDSQNKGPAVLFVHGNSACKEIWQKQFHDCKHFRYIAIDLPGHGISGNAVDPANTYSLPGYADVTMEVLRTLGVRKVTVVGWSLGGHIAIDMLRYPEVQGILITGTPPIPLTPEGFKKGFKPFPCLHLLSQESFTKEEAEMFISQGGIKTEEAPFLLAATLKTHGLARSHLIASMQHGIGGDQKAIVENSTKPVAIVAGIDDAGINNSYIEKEVDSSAFWRGRIQYLKGGHGVFWEKPQEFNRILHAFLRNVNSSRTFSKQIAYRYAVRFACIATVAALGIALFKCKAISG